MLASDFRLKEYRELRQVKEEGVLKQRKFFGVLVYRRDDKVNSKFSFVISTKVAKEAVQRNRIKRAMSEAVRFSLTECKDGYSVMFLAKTCIKRESTDSIMKAVKRFLDSSELKKGKK